MSRKLFLLFCAALVGASTGCSSMKNAKMIPQSLADTVQSVSKDLFTKNSDSEFEEPVRMAAIWSEGLYDEIGQEAVRGFGARIFFYNEEGMPIKADGELRVYGYDDETNKDGFAPDRMFVFKQENFQSHYSESELGASYSVWVPWDKVGGERKTISLIPMFKFGKGKVVKGGQTVTVLTGKERNELKISTHEGIKEFTKKVREYTVEHANYQADSKGSKVQSASYEGEDSASSDSAEMESKGNGNVETIQLSPSMKRRLRTLPPPKTFTQKRMDRERERKEDKRKAREAQNQNRGPTFIQAPMPPREQSEETKSPAREPATFGKPGAFR